MGIRNRRSLLRTARWVIGALVILLMFGCAISNRSSKEPYEQTGMASWYGKPFHGKKTASGERFNMRKMTAAHQSLPFGTMVRVTHLKNKKSVVVRINDRGPFRRGRIIDLSRKAAKKLGMIEEGIAEVRIQVLY